MISLFMNFYGKIIAVLIIYLYIKTCSCWWVHGNDSKL